MAIERAGLVPSCSQEVGTVIAKALSSIARYPAGKPEPPPIRRVAIWETTSGAGSVTRSFIRRSQMTIGTILLIILILLLIGAVPSWPHSRSWGYGPSGILGVVLIVVIVLLLMGRI
jgi:hypothetical protein